MYNRYVRNDNGSYSRIPQEENRPPTSAPHQPQQDMPAVEKKDQPKQHSFAAAVPPPPTNKKQTKDGLTGILRHFLDQFHLDQVDTGDLLLLILLFFLFREDADEELLVSLGLLLIL